MSDQDSNQRHRAELDTRSRVIVSEANVHPRRVDVMVSRTSMPELRVETRVDRDRALECPAWRDDAVNPPVSAREAIQSARDAVASLDYPSNEIEREIEWKMHSAELRPFSLPNTDVGGH